MVDVQGKVVAKDREDGKVGQALANYESVIRPLLLPLNVWRVYSSFREIQPTRVSVHHGGRTSIV